MNRADLRRLAETRLQDANVLFDNKRYAGAYYLAGYAVECALKACIAGNTRKGQFPDLETVRQSYSHKLESLVGVAGLRPQLEEQIKRDANFAVNWALTVTWKETSRYEFRARSDARDLLEAVADPKSGVLAWLRALW